MSFAPFEEGDRVTREAPHELLALPPESPLPPWAPDAYNEALLLFAHPDDEILFAGGLMLRYPHWRWHLVCATGEAERARALSAARGALVRAGVDATVLCLGLKDRYAPEDVAEWGDAIRGAIPDWTPEVVFTHGARGEYGHHHHIWLNHIAHAFYPNVWDFLSPCWRVKQLAKTLVREVPTDTRKVAIFDAAYGDIAAGLRANAPWLVEAQLTGHPEYFTQGVVGV